MIDFSGIADRLPYLKELGITATWLSPIFTSPMADFGYDMYKAKTNVRRVHRRCAALL